MKREDWTEIPFVADYLSKLREQFENATAFDEKFIETIEYEQNYGVIIFTKEVLSHVLVQSFLGHIEKQLMFVGYMKGRIEGKLTLFQAPARLRVAGNQLYGNIRLIEKSEEIHILVMPYQDRSYNTIADRNEFIKLLLS